MTLVEIIGVPDSLKQIFTEFASTLNEV